MDELGRAEESESDARKAGDGSDADAVAAASARLLGDDDDDAANAGEAEEDGEDEQSYMDAGASAAARERRREVSAAAANGAVGSEGNDQVVESDASAPSFVPPRRKRTRPRPEAESGTVQLLTWHSFPFHIVLACLLLCVLVPDVVSEFDSQLVPFSSSPPGLRVCMPVGLAIAVPSTLDTEFRCFVVLFVLLIVVVVALLLYFVFFQVRVCKSHACKIATKLLYIVCLRFVRGGRA